MYPNPIAAPRENGQPIAAHPAYLGEHITLAVSSKWQPSAGDKVAVVSNQIVTHRDIHARITTAPQPSVTPQIVTNVTSRPASLPRPNVNNVEKRDNHAAAVPAALMRPAVINVITSSTQHSALSTHHSSLSPTPRNIKATSGWLWQEHDALAVIAAEYGVGERGRAARSVYFALTQVASQQRTPDRAHTSCAYLGTVALLGESAVRRYLHEFITLGLIAVIPGVHQANTYILLAVGGDDKLAEGAMPLADGAGESLAIRSEVGSYSERATAGDTPTLPQRKARAAAADSPTVAAFSTRATAGASQIRRIKDSKKKTTNTSAAGAAANCLNDFHAENPAPTTNNISVQIPLAGTLPLTSEQQAAATSLTGIGVRRTVAEQVAATCNPDDVRGWVRYAIRTGGLKSRAGFVLSMLRLGEAPPDAAAEYHLPSYKLPVTGDEHQNASGDNNAAPDGVERLTAATAAANIPAPTPVTVDCDLQIADPGLQNEDCPDTDTGDNTQHSCLSTQHSALWLAAREELARRVTDPAWGLWLKHVRLVAVEGDTWRLSRPSCGVAESYERRHHAEVEGVLADITGEDVVVAWVDAGQIAA